MKNRVFLVSSLLSLVVTLHHAPAMAEPSGSEKAAAEALFQEGAELIATDKIAEACAKFEASQQLDPALGTQLRLADCWDRVHKTASAWALFQEVASTAGMRNQADRERIANERATDLAKRLSKLTVTIDTGKQPADVEVRLNGVVIPRATWNTAIPVDPGRQRIEVSAPKYHPWSGHIDVPKGPVERSIPIPLLVAKPEEPAASPSVTPGAPQDSGSKRGSVQRTFGYVTTGLGLLGVAAGGFLSYRAYDLNRQSMDECRSDDPNACTSTGVDMRDNAQAHATGATVAFGVGAGLLATGVILIATAPKAEQRTALRISTHGKSGGRISLEGVW